jgi:hypothetical protein
MYETLAKIYGEVYAAVMTKQGSTWDAKRAAHDAVKDFLELMEEMKSGI